MSWPKTIEPDENFINNWGVPPRAFEAQSYGWHTHFYDTPFPFKQDKQQMFYFLKFYNDGSEQCMMFYNQEDLWKYLQEYKNKKGALPLKFSVFKAECIFDGS